MPSWFSRCGRAPSSGVFHFRAFPSTKWRVYLTDISRKFSRPMERQPTANDISAGSVSVRRWLCWASNWSWSNAKRLWRGTPIGSITWMSGICGRNPSRFLADSCARPARRADWRGRRKNPRNGCRTVRPEQPRRGGSGGALSREAECLMRSPHMPVRYTAGWA